MRPGDRRFDLEVAVYLCASLLIAPISWIHHRVFALPATAILAVHFAREARWVPLILTAGSMAVLFRNPLPFREDPVTGVAAALAIGPQLWVLILLWGLGLYAAAREPENATESPF